MSESEEGYKDPQAESNYLFSATFDLVWRAMPWLTPPAAVATALSVSYMVRAGAIPWHRVVEWLHP